MISRTITRSCAAAACLVLLPTFATPTRAIVIDAIQDTWIRESAADTDYNDDLISVWDGTVGDQRRQGALLFDLNSTVGVTINSAYLHLFDRNDNRSKNFPIVQQAYVLSATPPSPQFGAPYTWNEYNTFDAPNELAFDSLGGYNIAVGDLINGYEASSLASAADITKLVQARDNNSNLVAIVLKAASGQRDWGDIEADGTVPRLVINQPLPVFGDFNDDFMVTTADFDIMIDPLNWLQQVPFGTRGDLSGDGTVGIADFSLFKPVYQAANPGAGSSTGVTPEPSGLMLALACAAILGITFTGRRRFRVRMPVVATMVTFLVLSLLPTLAHAIVLEAVSEVWLRERDPSKDTTFENDLISVWNSLATDAGNRRYGVVEFDVSSLSATQINSASLSLWNGLTGFSDQNKAIKQSAVFINTTGGTQAASLTWNIYQSEYASSAVPLGGLGVFNLPSQVAPDAYSNSAAATAADRTVIANAASSGNQRLTLVMIANESDGVQYAHSWGDGPDGFGGMNPQLLINEVTEQVTLTLRINSITGQMSIVNPGLDPTVNTMFDIDGYVIHSPAGALNPAGFTGIVGTGQPDWQIISPTATDLSELNLDSSTVFSEGDSPRSLGIGFTPGASPDLGLTFNYNIEGGAPATGLVEYVTSLPGDYNQDGVVNAADYVMWRKGSSPDSSPAGYALWRQNFGTSAGGIGSSAVPEPASIRGFAAMLGLALAISRRKLPRGA
jgi:hypothetical protein